MFALLAAGKIVEGVEPHIQDNNLECITAHFNSTFDGSKEVNVQLTKCILDLRKHSIVIFKGNPNFIEHTKGRRTETLGTNISSNKE